MNFRLNTSETKNSKELSIACNCLSPSFVALSVLISLSLPAYAHTKQEIEAAKRIVQTNKPAKPAVNLADKYNKEGLIHIRNSNFAQAEKLLLMAVEDAREQGSEQALSSSLTNLGIAYARQNKWEQAESSFKEALSIKEKAFGKSSTSVATTLQHYASMLREARRTDEALPLETRIRQILSGKPEQIITTTTKSTTITSVEQGGKSGTSKTSQTVNTSKVSIESNIEATQTTSEPLISKKERLSNEADKIGNILQKKAKAADNANDKIDLTTKEYEQILNSADAIMASIPHSHQAREILAASKQQGLAYRKKLESFMNEGGSDPKSIKTKIELDNRIKQVQDLSSSFKAYQKACAGFLANSTSPQAQKNTQIMDMESKLLDEFSFQLKFLAENWGKWAWDPENRLQMWLPKVKIAIYNASVDKVRSLSGTQQTAIKESTNHTLQNLENIKKKL